MEQLTKEQCERFILKKIDYENALKAAREYNRNELRVFIRLNGKKDYDIYRKLCMLKKLEVKNKKDFNKWYKDYGKNLDKKIKNYSDSYNLELEYVKNKIKENDEFACQFAVDPGKQTIHEHNAANYIKNNIPFVYEFEELESNTKNSLYVDNGAVVKKQENQEVKTKSIDFRWCYKFKDKKLYFYATHKCTNERGGAQDNQFKDVEIFLNEARNSINPNIVFLSITDGTYYEKKIKKYGKEITRLEYLKQAYKGQRVISTTANDLLKDIIPFIEEWLETNFSKEEYEDELNNIKIIKEKITVKDVKKIKMPRTIKISK